MGRADRKVDGACARAVSPRGGPEDYLVLATLGYTQDWVLGLAVAAIRSIEGGFGITGTVIKLSFKFAIISLLVCHCSNVPVTLWREIDTPPCNCHWANQRLLIRASAHMIRVQLHRELGEKKLGEGFATK